MTHPWHVLFPSGSVSPISRGTPDKAPAAMPAETCACPQTGLHPQQQCAVCQQMHHTLRLTAAFAAPAMPPRPASLLRQVGLVCLGPGRVVLKGFTHEVQHVQGRICLQGGTVQIWRSGRFLLMTQEADIPTYTTHSKSSA